jgi:hypothetical protein
MPQLIQDMSLNFKKAYVQYYNATRWTSYVDNPDCVLHEVNYEYYKAIKDVADNASSYFWLIVILCAAGGLVIIALIIVIIKCRGKGDDDEDQEDNKLGPTTKEP